MLGGPVFRREVLATSRRKRTYVFQTTFLAVLVLCLIPPLANVSSGKSGAQIAETGRLIFEYGGYLQVILLALLAPAVTRRTSPTRAPARSRSCGGSSSPACSTWCSCCS